MRCAKRWIRKSAGWFFAALRKGDGRKDGILGGYIIGWEARKERPGAEIAIPGFNLCSHVYGTMRWLYYKQESQGTKGYYCPSLHCTELVTGRNISHWRFCQGNTLTLKDQGRVDRISRRNKSCNNCIIFDVNGQKNTRCSGLPSSDTQTLLY